jgi:uncharacterized protein
MRAVVTGATGFVGRNLLKRLDRPNVLSRDVDRARRALAAFNINAFSWDPIKEEPPAAAFDGVDAVLHLAGDPVADGRWTAEKKQRIRDSRVLGTRHLVDALRKLERRPSVLVSASAVGWYGSRGDEVLDETSPPAHDFLADVCVAWEQEARRAAEFGIRVVSIRTGMVLGDGGALSKMLPPFRFGLGGPLGNGKQWVAWIHVDDLAAMYLYAAENTNVSGPMNGVAPQPVTNKEFTKVLAAVVHRPAVLPAPYFALRLAFGEFAQILFDSQRVMPKAAEHCGFQFQYPQLLPALEAILSPPPENRRE